MLRKGDGLQLTVCAIYSWEMPLNIGLDESFDNTEDWKAIREVNITDACVTNDGSLRWIRSGRYVRVDAKSGVG
jgi:hypothetical protein